MKEDNINSDSEYQSCQNVLIGKTASLRSYVCVFVCRYRCALSPVCRQVYKQTCVCLFVFMETLIELSSL